MREWSKRSKRKSRQRSDKVHVINHLNKEVTPLDLVYETADSKFAAVTVISTC